MIFISRLLNAFRVIYLYLLIAYLLLIGGQYYGLVVYQINILSTIILIVSSILWIVWRIHSKNGFIQTQLDLPIWLGLIALVANVIFSIDPSRSASAAFLSIVVAILYWVTADVIAGGASLRMIGRAITVSGAVIAAIAFIQVILFWRDWLSLGLLPQASFRVAAPNPTAAFLNFVWVFWIAELIESKRWSARIFFASAIIVVGIVLLYTSSRGGWLGAGAAAMIFLLVYRRALWTQVQKIWTHTILRNAVIIGILLVTLLASAIAVRQWSHATHADVFSARSEFWPIAWDVFLRFPLTGTGLFTYASSYLPSLSIPPRGIFNQAHGLIFNLIAETGLFGIGTALIIFFVFIKNVRHVFNLSAKESNWRVAALAGLGATFAHSFFETPYVNPPVMILIAITCAMVLPTLTTRTWRHISVLVVLIFGSVWSVWAYAPLHDAIELGNKGQWREAATLFDEAIKRDPFSTWAKFQSAYSYHRTGDSSRAITLYQDALKHEPGYSINWANLAASQWANGDRAGAKTSLAYVRTIAPESILFSLTESKWFGMPTPLVERDEVGERILDALANRIAVNELNQDRQRLAASFESRAITQIQVIQLAEIEIINKNLPRAEYLLSYANAMRGDDGIALEYAYGDLDFVRGNMQSATKRYEKAWSLHSQPNIYLGTQYGWLIFVRESLNEDIAPELANPLLQDVRARMKILVNRYRSLGDESSANKLESQLLSP